MDLSISNLRYPDELDKKTSNAATFSDEEILKELCIGNGVAHDRLIIEGPLVDTIEAFFSGFPRFISLNLHFPNIVSICIVGQTVSEIEKIEALSKLEELWIAECQLEKISGLRSLSHLQKLYLHDNRIKTISGLEALTELKVLWLAANQITSLEGVERLVNLTELNIAENKLSHISTHLSRCTVLTTLELSGNLISSFSELNHLINLPSLKILGFSDPKYRPNPICELCNYTTQVLYHLPGLERLDGHDLTMKPYADLAQSTVLKKLMFYNMKVKILTNQAQAFSRRLTDHKEHVLLKDVNEHLTVLWLELKALEKELPALYETLEGEEIEQLEDKMRKLEKRINSWEIKRKRIEDQYLTYKSYTYTSLTNLSQRLYLDLDSGGNIRFTPGKPNDVWFSSCYDMLLSSFCAADYKELGIQGVKIHSITRVCNRMLRFKFESKLSEVYPEYSGGEENTYRQLKLHKKVDYMYYVWPSTGSHDSLQLVEHGVPETHDGHQAVCLTNGLSLADAPRVLREMKETKHQSIDSPSYKHGSVVLCKTFIGKTDSVPDGTALVSKPSQPFDSVHSSRKVRPFAHITSQTSSIINLERRSESSLHGSNGSCGCPNKQTMWYIFDNSLILPEYIIEFEYVFKLQASNMFSQFDFVTLEVPPMMNSDTSVVSQMSADDEEILNMKPLLDQNGKQQLLKLEPAKLLNYLHVESLEHVTTLNLHDQGLTNLNGINLLLALKRLIVSFNHLSSLEAIAGMNIEGLDASFNKITSLDGMKNMAKLLKLDISWNCMRYIRDEFAILRKHAPNLQELNSLHNLWLKANDFRLRVISKLRSLQKLDGIEVSEAEATSALRIAAGARIMPLHIMSHGRTDTIRPRSLSLTFTAQILQSISRLVPDRTSQPSDTTWMSAVTSLCLDNQHICKLSSLEKLISLRWASFNNNHIVKIEGLELCTRLEELSLDNNCIYKLESIHRLTSLKRLSLSDNYIVTLDPYQLERLTHLHYLAIDHNKIQSFNGVQRCRSLIELYAAHNRINNLREAFFIKSCSHLLILDMNDNPVSRTDQYRMFLIYHISSLKVLDGHLVDTLELNNARETLGGRLTADFIAEKVGHSNFSDIKELDLPSLSLRSVDLGSADAFIGLRSINLEHNNLTTFGGLVHLPNLRVLCLNHNKIECISSTSEPHKELSSQSNEYAIHKVTPILDSLEVLHLAYNNIKDLSTLGISRLTGLKALFLQGNELQTISGLEGLHDLRELVVDKNKIKNLTESSFSNQWNLQELHMEENRLRELSYLNSLDNLQRLYLGMNRIQDLQELEKLCSLTQLVDISLVSCPVSRRLVHRPLLVYRLPSLAVIDGIPVTEEESLKAQLYYMQQEQQNQNEALPGISPNNPGILMRSGSVPVKVTNMSLGTFGERTPWSGTLQFDPALLATQLEPPRDNSQTGRKANQAQGNQRGTNAQQFNIQSTYANQTSQPNKSLYSDYQTNSNPFNRPRK